MDFSTMLWFRNKNKPSHEDAERCLKIRSVLRSGNSVSAEDWQFCNHLRKTYPKWFKHIENHVTVETIPVEVIEGFRMHVPALPKNSTRYPMYTDWRDPRVEKDENNCHHLDRGMPPENHNKLTCMLLDALEEVEARVIDVEVSKVHPDEVRILDAIAQAKNIMYGKDPTQFEWKE